MRVLIAALHRNIVGGVEKYLQALVPQLLQRGHQVSIAHAYRGNPESEMIDPRDGSVQAWSFEEYGGEGVQRAVQQWAPDVVYSNGLEQEDSKDVFRHYPTVRFSHDYKGTC